MHALAVISAVHALVVAIPADSHSEALLAIKKGCVGCHDNSDPAGGLELESMVASASPESLASAQWREVARRLRIGEMPPEGEPPLGAEELQAILALTDEQAPPPPQSPPPALRRLNRGEIGRALRDCVLVSVDAQARLPADDIGAGFDTVASVQTIAPIFLEGVLDVAEQAAHQAMGGGSDEPRRLGAEELVTRGGLKQSGATLHMFAEAEARIRVAQPGQYVLRLEACGDQMGDEPVRLEVSAGQRRVGRLEVPASREEPEIYELPLELLPGDASIAVRFANDAYRPNDPDPAQRDRNAIINWIELRGPLGNSLLTPFERWLAERSGDPVATTLSRLWRRNVTAGEAQEWSARMPGAGPELLLQAAIASPNFLLRSEVDPWRPSAEELATRLSFFIWSSAPDEALQAAAVGGELSTPDGLRRQVQRMLTDPRSLALAERFATQWLQIERLDRAAPDPELFATVGPAMLDSMRWETILCFDACMREERPVRELLDSTFTFVDGPLAQHYGMGPLEGSAMRRVPVEHGGLLRQASVLTATSNPNRTNPPKRGKWVLEALLDRPPQPPPPGVPPFPEHQAGKELTVRQRLELHRADPACAACHDSIDPIGLALEAADPVGKTRTHDGAQAVDSRGEFPSGLQVDGVDGLRSYLLKQRGFLRSLARNMLVYSIGRGTDEGDEPTIDRLVGVLEQQGTISALVQAIVREDVFSGRGRTLP